MSRSNFDNMRERLLIRAGLHIPVLKSPPLAQLIKSEWSKRFEVYMRNRLIMGALRYGTIEENRQKRRNYDRLGSIRKRLDAYVITGNDELLVDCANLLMLEYELGQHPNKHFRAEDSREFHVKVKSSSIGTQPAS